MSLLSYFYWDPNPEIFVLPIVHWPILWYGAFFAVGFAVGFCLFYSLLCRYFFHLYRDGFKDPVYSRAALKKKAMKLSDRLTLYMVVATVLGARLGHFLFYERPSEYLSDPLELFLVWKGGLASHGAAIGIVFAVILFAYRYKQQLDGITWIRLLDYVCVPTAFAGGCIRLGNFFNQEILGTQTNVPWAVIFGHPMDRSFPIPRHPVQLYEAFFYFTVFVLLWCLSYRPKFFLSKGRLLGLFLVLVFGFRFLVEFLKLEQSVLLSKASEFTMGQWLSIFPVLAGIVLLYMSRSKCGSCKN